MISIKIMYREILEKFCKVFGLSLYLEQDPKIEMWICKTTTSANLDCVIFGWEPSDKMIRVWSGYCRTVEEVCKNYIETMLGCYLSTELESILINRGNSFEIPRSGKFILIPKTLEEFMIWIDLQQSATVVSSS